MFRGARDFFHRHPRAEWQFQAIAAAFCFLFGVALIATSQLANDGGWYWYAVLHHGGERLYADMHLVLQPFFVLETEAWMWLVGKGWMVSKVPALLHLLAFTACIALLSARTRLKDFEKAILTAFGFFVGIHFEAYRFDDYHVVEHICFLVSVLLLLKLDEECTLRREIAIVSLLGILSGIGITNRFTDGVALACCVALAIIVIAKARKLALVAAFLAVTFLVVISIVSLTGDSIAAYVQWTVFGAAAAKGGAANVLVRPLVLPWNSILALCSIPPNSPWIRPPFALALASLWMAACWAFLVRPFSKANPASVIKATVGLAIICGTVSWMGLNFLAGYNIRITSALGVLLAYLLAPYVLCTAALRLLKVKWAADYDPKRIVLMLPFALLLTGSLSSGGHHFGLYAPIAFFVLLLPVVFPAAFEVKWLRSAFLALAALFAISGVCFKVLSPVSWNNYTTFPMYMGRSLVHHPVYGPMVIDRYLNGFADSVCSTIEARGKPELLSIPFPYANYYCNIPPWEEYVQTFFDTSSKEMIDEMILKLRRSPPQWVLYQRQLDILALHEAVFNHGNRLPHRDLDDFLMSKIASGEWHVVSVVRYGDGADWILLKTY